jgi:hypothetical protein
MYLFIAVDLMKVIYEALSNHSVEFSWILSRKSLGFLST